MKKQKVLLGMLAAFIFLQPAIAQRKGQPSVIAHRGASADAPENTLAAFRKGWELTDAVELDVHVTADGKLVVMHDDNTKRTTGVDYKIAATTAENIRTLDAGKWKGTQFVGERVPFLYEVLDAMPAGKKLVIELKAGMPVVEPVKEAVLASGKMKQCIAIGFDFKAVAAFKKLMPSVPAYWLTGKIDSMQYTVMIDSVKRAGIDGINVHYGTATPGLAAACRKARMPLLVWTVNDPEIALRMRDLGVTAITTDKPAMVHDLLAAKKKKKKKNN